MLLTSLWSASGPKASNLLTEFSLKKYWFYPNHLHISWMKQNMPFLVRFEKETGKINQLAPLTYFQPRVVLQHWQYISATACSPVSRTRSSAGPVPIFTLKKTMIFVPSLILGIMEFESAEIIETWFRKKKCQRQYVKMEKKTFDALKKPMSSY